MSSLAAKLVEHFSVRGSELQVGGVAVSTLAKTYGTPLFVYDRAILDKKFNMLRDALPPAFEIYYSVKANPNPAIARHFVSRGCGLEIASEGELLLAQAAGCSPDRIVFAGPGKSDKELEAAIARRIGEIHVESQNEALRIARICQATGNTIRLAVRVNPTGDAQGGAMRMGGKPAPFGIDEEKVLEVVEYIRSQPALEFSGIHMFSGTQILDHAVLVNQYRKCVEIARRLSREFRQPLRTVDFGGGLGVPYFEGDRELDLSALKVELAALWDELRMDADFRGTRFLVEPGRFLVAEAGVYISTIRDIKESRGKTFIIVDGGMHHHLAASGNLGQTIKRNYPLLMLQRVGQTEELTADVVGPLCTPLDTVGRSVTLAKSEIGELVGIFQSGAYARTASPLGFLSHPTPAEVWVDDGEHQLIRKAGAASDVLLGTVLPSSPVTKQ